jgi:formiminoglutamate deiminase
VIARSGPRIALDGIASAHSHAFQRALRGRTHGRSSAKQSFWSWRELMYSLASKLDPESIYAISRFAFAELAMCGVTAVGEFHYVHHDANGAPYSDRIVLAREVVRAARDVGLRIALLRVIYERAGAGRPPEPAQRRFCDSSIDEALADVEALRRELAGDPMVTVGIAPHSLRAVRIESVERACEHARRHGLPLHMHVAEQRCEVDECVAEHGMRPVELLADRGVLDDRFCAVHATHLVPHEAQALGAARAFACVCRTTERDLGDGLPDAGALASGARLCFGADSHASSDPFEEARAIELDERTRTESRCAALDGDALVRAMTEHGYAAIGMPGRHAEDRVELGPDPSVAGASEATLADAVVFGAATRAVKTVRVGGRVLVEDGVLPNLDEITRAFEATVRSLLDGRSKPSDR